MPSPALIFGFLVATLYGSLAHLIGGGDVRRLAMFLMSTWLGFILGHMIGDILSLNFANVGVVHFFAASLGSAIALSVTGILTRRSEVEQL